MQFSNYGNHVALWELNRATVTCGNVLLFQSWLHTWKIKMNESKSTYLTFTLRRDPSPTIYINNIEIPPVTTVKYLGLHLDNKLNWKEHIIKKRQQMDLQHTELCWLLGRPSPLSVGNNLSLLLYGPMALNYGAVLASPILQSTEMPV